MLLHSELLTWFLLDDVKVETDLAELQMYFLQYSTVGQHLNVIPLTGKQHGRKPFDIIIARIAGAAPELCPIDMKARWQCFLHERAFCARSRYGKIGSVDPCLMVSGRRTMSKPFAAPSVCVHCMLGSIVPSNGRHSGLSCSRSRSKPKSRLQKSRRNEGRK